MRNLAGRMTVTITLSILLVAAVGIGVARASSTPPPVVQISGSLDGTNGYRLRLDGYADHFTLHAKRGGVGATYYVKATVSPNRLSADLGRFGSLDLAFDPVGPPQEKPRPRRCKGLGPLVQQGVLRGSLSFHGEGGFTSAETQTVTGRVTTYRGGGTCLIPAKSVRGMQLEVLNTSGNPSDMSRFTALRVDGTGGRAAFFSAGSFGRIGSVSVGRYAFTAGSRATFRVDRRRMQARVSPPPPFSGSARVKRWPRRRASWSGDLSVALPGLGSLSLTGPSFRASMFRSAFPDPAVSPAIPGGPALTGARHDR